jgi:hypothetical protein
MVEHNIPEEFRVFCMRENRVFGDNAARGYATSGGLRPFRS